MSSQFTCGSTTSITTKMYLDCIFLSSLLKFSFYARTTPIYILLDNGLSLLSLNINVAVDIDMHRGIRSIFILFIMVILLEFITSINLSS